MPKWNSAGVVCTQTSLVLLLFILSAFKLTWCSDILLWFGRDLELQLHHSSGTFNTKIVHHVPASFTQTQGLICLHLSIWTNTSSVPFVKIPWSRGYIKFTLELQRSALLIIEQRHNIEVNDVSSLNVVLLQLNSWAVTIHRSAEDDNVITLIFLII